MLGVGLKQERIVSVASLSASLQEPRALPFTVLGPGALEPCHSPVPCGLRPHGWDSGTPRGTHSDVTVLWGCAVYCGATQAPLCSQYSLPLCLGDMFYLFKFHCSQRDRAGQSAVPHRNCVTACSFHPKTPLTFNRMQICS